MTDYIIPALFAAALLYFLYRVLKSKGVLDELFSENDSEGGTDLRGTARSAGSAIGSVFTWLSQNSFVQFLAKLVAIVLVIWFLVDYLNEPKIITVEYGPDKPDTYFSYDFDGDDYEAFFVDPDEFKKLNLRFIYRSGKYADKPAGSLDPTSGTAANIQGKHTYYSTAKVHSLDGSSGSFQMELRRK